MVMATLFAVSPLLFSEAVSLGEVFPEQPVGVKTIGPGGGGFIDALLASRHNRNRFYAGCDVGGFYRSDDAGRTWKILNDGFSNGMCHSIAEHPKNPEILVAGSDGGVYVSRDGGLHWTNPTNGFPVARNFGYARPIIEVVFDESNPDHVWAASGCPRGRTGESHKAGRMGRIFESFDAGATWKQINDESKVVTKKGMEIRSISPNMKNPKDLLVATNEGLFRSLDGGRHWSAIGSGLPDCEGLQLECISRCDAVPEVIYLTARADKGKVPRKCGVWKSVDGGATWTETAMPKDGSLQYAGLWAHSYWSYPHIVADPANPDVCWAASASWLTPNGVFKTVDGGKSWQQKFDMKHRGWLNMWGFYSGALTVSKAHPGSVAWGTSGTIYRTDDEGKTWRQCYTIERADGKLEGNGLETICSQCVYADLYRRDRLFLGFNDVGFFVSDDRGKSLTRAMKGIPPRFSNSCFDLKQAEDDPDRVWAVFGRWGADESGIFCESTDGGMSWNVKTNGFVCGAWAQIAVVNGRKPYVLAVVRTGYERRERSGTTISYDGGDTWNEVSTNALPIAKRPTAIAVHKGVILVGSGAGKEKGARIFASKDLGKSWFEFKSFGEMKAGNVREFAIRGKTIAVAAQSVNCGKGGVYVSRDAGKTWKQVLLDWCSSSIRFAGADLIAGCPKPGWRDPCELGYGLVVSSDFGETWRQCRGEGFYRAQISHIAVDPFDESRVFVGTGGNGDYEIDLEPDAIRLKDGAYGGHLQDVCRAGDCLYWAHTRTILKTDLKGRVLASVKDPHHNAGCRVKDGKLYVAVCRVGGRISKEAMKEHPLQINIYDANDLHLIERKFVEGAFDRAGSLEILPNGNFVVGCLRPPDVREDQVRFYVLDPQLKLISRREIDHTPVKLGIEVIKYFRGDLFLFLYGGKTIRLDAETFAEKGRHAGTEGQIGCVMDKDCYWVGKCRVRKDTKPEVFDSCLVRRPLSRLGFSKENK